MSDVSTSDPSTCCQKCCHNYLYITLESAMLDVMLLETQIVRQNNPSLTQPALSVKPCSHSSFSRLNIWSLSKLPLFVHPKGKGKIIVPQKKKLTLLYTMSAVVCYVEHTALI